MATETRVLVGWDDDAEAETIELLLSVDDKKIQVVTDPEFFLGLALETDYDVLLMALNLPTSEAALAIFEQIRARRPEIPVVGACDPGETVKVCRFMARGLKSYVTRDESGEFIFLLTPMLEAARESVATERARILAERLRQEIESVRRLQESLLPRNLPTPAGYCVAARYEPSQIQVVGNQPVMMAGGDYYDLFNLGNDKLVVLVGDASGHGMKACMSIMTMHTLIGMIRNGDYMDTAHFVDEVNRRLCDNNIIQDQGGFITFLYCMLDFKSRTLEWTSAGHPMPMLHDLTTGEVRNLGANCDGGLPLGISTDLPYDICRASFPENSRILFFTDGLPEAFQVAGEKSVQFGEDGIRQTLRRLADASADLTVDGLLFDSNAFTKGEGRHDDTSIVLIEQRTS